MCWSCDSVRESGTQENKVIVLLLSLTRRDKVHPEAL